MLLSSLKDWTHCCFELFVFVSYIELFYLQTKTRTVLYNLQNKTIVMLVNKKTTYFLRLSGVRLNTILYCLFFSLKLICFTAACGSCQIKQLCQQYRKTWALDFPVFFSLFPSHCQDGTDKINYSEMIGVCIMILNCFSSCLSVSFKEPKLHNYAGKSSYFGVET